MTEDRKLTDDEKFRNWFHRLPGTITGRSVADCLEQVRQAAGIEGDVGVVKAILNRYGWAVSKVGTKHLIAFPQGELEPLGGWS